MTPTPSPTSEPQSWAKGFDKEFQHSETCDAQRFEELEKEPFADCYCQLKTIKSFISSELNRREKEVIKNIIDLIKKYETNPADPIRD